jgi:predicted dehydrogenase
VNDKVRWGVLGVAKIAVEKVIPAMQRGANCEVVAIASRELQKAKAAADRLGIPKSYGSYEELLADDEVQAIYNPLPNHLHVPWSIRAAESGKHVLCEKPIALSVDEARTLVGVRDRTGARIQEAFMVRTHPQWIGARDLVRQGRIGELCSMAGYFSYYNRDPTNIRNVPQYGGGALMDIGCYLIHTSRFIFGSTPDRVSAVIDRDPEMGTDRLTSFVMEFTNTDSVYRGTSVGAPGARGDRTDGRPNTGSGVIPHCSAGHSIGTCSTQAAPYQRVQIVGTHGRIEIEIPFNAPPDRSCRIFVDDGSSLLGRGIEIVEFPACDQYTIQGDLFSLAILQDLAQAVPLEDSIENMAVIEAVFRSAKSGAWERCR